MMIKFNLLGALFRKIELAIVLGTGVLIGLTASKAMDQILKPQNDTSNDDGELGKKKAEKLKEELTNKVKVPESIK